jgi:hypothetical protein
LQLQLAAVEESMDLSWYLMVISDSFHRNWMGLRWFKELS